MSHVHPWLRGLLSGMIFSPAGYRGSLGITPWTLALPRPNPSAGVYHLWRRRALTANTFTGALAEADFVAVVGDEATLVRMLPSGKSAGFYLWEWVSSAPVLEQGIESCRAARS